MRITIWHKSGAGTATTADDFAYIEVDNKTVWNADALKNKELAATVRPVGPANNRSDEIALPLSDIHATARLYLSGHTLASFTNEIQRRAQLRAMR